MEVAYLNRAPLFVGREKSTCCIKILKSRRNETRQDDELQYFHIFVFHILATVL